MLLAQVANGRHRRVDGRDVRQVRTQQIVVQVLLLAQFMSRLPGLRLISIWSAIQRINDPPCERDELATGGTWSPWWSHRS